MTEEDAMEMEYGIKIEKVNKAHMQSVLSDYEDPAAAERDGGKLVAAMVRRFANAPDVGICDSCGGRSPSALHACPFCGAVGEVKDAPNGSSAADVVAQDDKGDVGDSAAAAPTQPQDPTNDPVASDPAPINGAALARRTKTKSGITKVSEKPVETVAVTEVITNEVLVTDDLDVAYTWCREAKIAGTVALWKLGHGAGVIVDKKLWMQRKKPNGKQAYGSFDAWCLAELGMTHGNVYELIDVARKFSEMEVRQWGTTNCGLLMRAPDEARPAIEEKLKTGELKTTREVKAAVREARVKAGTLGKPRVTGRKPMPQPKTRRVSDKITIAMTKPTRMLHFVTRSTMKDEEPKSAKRLADEPVVEIELTNRTKLRIALSHDPSGNIVGRMSVKRDEA